MTQTNGVSLTISTTEFMIFLCENNKLLTTSFTIKRNIIRTRVLFDENTQQTKRKRFVWFQCLQQTKRIDSSRSFCCVPRARMQTVSVCKLCAMCMGTNINRSVLHAHSPPLLCATVCVCVCVVCFVRTQRMPPIHSLSSSVFHSPFCAQRIQNVSHIIREHSSLSLCRPLFLSLSIIIIIRWSILWMFYEFRGIRTCIMYTAIGDETLFIE